MLTKRVFWEFSTHYVHHHKDQKWTPAVLGKDFKLTDGDLGDLRKIMVNRKVEVSDSVWTADRPFMLRQVRMEIATRHARPARALQDPRRGGHPAAVARSTIPAREQADVAGGDDAEQREVAPVASRVLESETDGPGRSTGAVVTIRPRPAP